MEEEYKALLEMKGITMEEVFDFFEKLRESGITNMFGAAPYAEAHFEVGRATARWMLNQWMASYAPEV